MAHHFGWQSNTLLSVKFPIFLKHQTGPSFRCVSDLVLSSVLSNFVISKADFIVSEWHPASVLFDCQFHGTLQQHPVWPCYGDLVACHRRQDDCLMWRCNPRGLISEHINQRGLSKSISNDNTHKNGLFGKILDEG